MQTKTHWDKVYATKAVDAVSWFQSHADQSLQMIQDTGIPLTASIIDVGGGASTLSDDLLEAGYSDLTVLDISEIALSATRLRLGRIGNSVKWIASNILDAKLPSNAYDIWHDRAVFHFLTSREERHAYVQAVLRAVKPNGHVIVATFADDGPTQCSGLPVMRYSASELHSQFGNPFQLIQHVEESHHTPFGTIQKFVYCHCRKAS